MIDLILNIGFIFFVFLFFLLIGLIIEIKSCFVSSIVLVLLCFFFIKALGYYDGYRDAQCQIGEYKFWGIRERSSGSTISDSSFSKIGFNKKELECLTLLIKSDYTFLMSKKVSFLIDSFGKWNYVSPTPFFDYGDYTITFNGRSDEGILYPGSCDKSSIISISLENSFSSSSLNKQISEFDMSFSRIK